MSPPDYRRITHMDTNTQATISFNLFHPRGPQVTFTGLSSGNVIAEIDALLGAGWSYLPPDLGLTDRIPISQAIRNLYTRKDSVQVERLLLYATFAEDQYGSTIKVWLDKPEDIARFENASGVVFAEMKQLVSSDRDPGNQSAIFSEHAVQVDFELDRKKEESASSPVGYKWVLVDYVGAAKSPPEPSPQQASTPPEVANVKPQAQKGKARDGAAKGLENGFDKGAEDAKAEADANSQTIVRVDYVQSPEKNDGEPCCLVYLRNGQKAFIKDLDIIRSLGVSTGDWKTGKVIQGAGWFGDPYLKMEKDYLLVTKIDPPKDWDALAEPEQAVGF